jgi:hypothetical protein
MQPRSSFPRGPLLGLLSLLLGLALTAGTALYQQRDYPVCSGALTAGYPLVFICDDNAGSPVSSWGRIDGADWFNLNLNAFLLDFLILSALLWLTWTVVAARFDKGPHRDENFRWGLLFCLWYLAVFLFAFLALQSTSLGIEVPRPRTPTPYIFSPTDSGTMPATFPTLPLPTP